MKTDTAAPVVLNDDQQKAFDELSEFVASDTDEMLCLKGYAGTGKTFLISKFIEDYMSKKENEHANICLSAPTNKAVMVLKQNADKELRRKVQFTTIHVVLGVKAFINEDGQEVFRSNDMHRTIDGLDILIVDEVSMLNDELFEKLLEHRDKVKIIFMGDPAQVPPVGKIDCEPFLNPEKHNINTVQLFQIMRQANGSKLVENSFEIRENIGKWHYNWMQDSGGFDFDIRKASDGIAKKQLRTDLEKLIRTDDFRKHVDQYKFIAWRNVRVDWFNQFVRNEFHGAMGEDLPQFLMMDLLIANNPVFEPGSDIQLLHTSQEVQVANVKKKKFKVDKNWYRGFELAVLYFDVDADKELLIHIAALDNRDKDDFERYLKVLADNAKNKLTPKEKRMAWKHFYKVKNFFADVSYSFALTAHKAQGSTYREVFVDMADIFRNGNSVERNRICYTAITRASKKCTVIIP